jgi:hypothetical protein
VCDKEVVRKITGPKRDEVTVEWRRLHNEELYDSFPTPHIIRVIKSMETWWGGRMTRIGGRRVNRFRGVTSGKEIV